MSNNAGGASIVRQKNVGSNDLVDSDSPAIISGLRSVSTSATLANAPNNNNNNNNANSNNTPSSTGVGIIGGGSIGTGVRSMSAAPAAAMAAMSNRSNSGGSSSVNARLNMMGLSSSRRSQPRNRREELEIFYQKCLKGKRKLIIINIFAG